MRGVCAETWLRDARPTYPADVAHGPVFDVTVHAHADWRRVLVVVNKSIVAYCGDDDQVATEVRNAWLDELLQGIDK